jgi:ribose-phosphate pyrophosphokinase
VTQTVRGRRHAPFPTRGAPLRLFAGSANRPLALAIARELGLDLGQMEVGRFSNGEVRVRIADNVRGTDVFVVESVSQPNEHLMELLVIADALRRASASRITAVIPYYPYARQDRKATGREPISAKLVANLLTTAGVDRVLTMDLHAPQIQGFFDIPLDHLTSMPILAQYLLRRLDGPTIVVSPDAGGVHRARLLAERLGVPVGFVDKRRPEPGVAEVVHVVGEVAGRTAILVDDMIDTAGTITAAAQALMGFGARQVYAAATHAVLSGPAVERLRQAPIRELVFTDTLPLPEGTDHRYQVLSVAPLLASAIRRIHEDRSVTRLFEEQDPGPPTLVGPGKEGRQPAQERRDPHGQ